jgi:hypothetical protein
MANIINNNFHNLKLKVNYDEYWDFFINKDSFPSYSREGLSTECLISYIDVNNKDCIVDNKLYGNADYIWDDAINSGVTLHNIGYTGVDNGQILFRKDRISNKEFLKLFTKSKLELPKDDFRFYLTQVSGNTMLYEYPSYYSNSDKSIIMNGGFYQGFFKIDGRNYQVLPDKIDNDWHFEFCLNKQNLKPESNNTLNDKHPNNKGIFFYIGTRAENKFWHLYGHNDNEIFDKNCDTSYILDNDNNDGYFRDIDTIIESHYSMEDLPEKEEEPYVIDGYLTDKCPEEETCKVDFIVDDYIDMKDYECCEEKKKSCCGIPGIYWFNLYESSQATYNHLSCDCQKNNIEKPDGKYIDSDSCCVNCCTNTTNTSCSNCHFPDKYWFNTYDTYGFFPIKNCCDGTCTCKNAVKNFFADCFLSDDDYGGWLTSPSKEYFGDDDYLEKDINLDTVKLMTYDDYPIDQANIFMFKSDNKFLLFNRTKTGFTTDTWIDGSDCIFTGVTNTSSENYFLLMNRTKTGYTVNTIEKLIKEKNNIYKVMPDLYYNALAFRIKDDGSIGYRYLTMNCDNTNYCDILEEYSKPNIIKEDVWHTINVRIKLLSPRLHKCDNKKRKMKLYFYVDGNLIFISSEIMALNLHRLNDISEKQETVPYNISIGGGSQGLCDMIMLNYYSLPKYILPIEKNFAGTFIGKFKSFKFYNCMMDYQKVYNNFKFEKTNQVK